MFLSFERTTFYYGIYDSQTLKKVKYGAQSYRVFYICNILYIVYYQYSYLYNL